jgi:hypothetical protein
MKRWQNRFSHDVDDSLKWCTIGGWIGCCSSLSYCSHLNDDDCDDYIDDDNNSNDDDYDNDNDSNVAKLILT